MNIEQHQQQQQRIDYDHCKLQQSFAIVYILKKKKWFCITHVNHSNAYTRVLSIQNSRTWNITWDHFCWSSRCKFQLLHVSVILISSKKYLYAIERRSWALKINWVNIDHVVCGHVTTTTHVLFPLAYYSMLLCCESSLLACSSAEQRGMISGRADATDKIIPVPVPGPVSFNVITRRSWRDIWYTNTTTNMW